MSPEEHDLDTAWNRRFSGSAKADKDCRGGALVFLQVLILMGDWCRQVGHYKTQRNYGKGKEVDGFRWCFARKKDIEPSASMGGASLATTGEKQLRLLQ